LLAPRVRPDDDLRRVPESEDFELEPEDFELEPEDFELDLLPLPLPLVEREDDERELAACFACCLLPLPFCARAPAPLVKRPVLSRGSS